MGAFELYRISQQVEKKLKVRQSSSVGFVEYTTEIMDGNSTSPAAQVSAKLPDRSTLMQSFQHDSPPMESPVIGKPI